MLCVVVSACVWEGIHAREDTGHQCRPGKIQGISEDHTKGTLLCNSNLPTTNVSLDRNRTIA